MHIEKENILSDEANALQGKRRAWAVDAACSGNPGPMEYRCVDLTTGEEVFHYGPVYGTNNIGEYLAIVHALALIENRKMCNIDIYTDSKTALSWIKRKRCKTTLSLTSETAPLFDVLKRADTWLQTHQIKVSILKWDTKEWGEIPADFNRK